MDIIRRYRPFGIPVTDLSSQLWCEKQLEFSLTKGRKRTAEMKKGKDVHDGLHEEIVDIVDVKPVTREDRFALKLYNSLVGLGMLESTGIAREIQIWGRINSLFVSGIIDELYKNDGAIKILDTKTRNQRNLPSEAQKHITRFQLMAYRHLLDSIINERFLPNHLVGFYNFDSSSRITDEFKSQIEGISDFKVKTNLLDLSKLVFDKVKNMDKISDYFEVRYISQDTREHIGNDKFKLNPEEFKRNCDFVEEFWQGKRKAYRVNENNKWKCSFCEFRELCFKEMNRLDSFFRR